MGSQRQHNAGQDGATGVVLLYMGGPETVAEVKPFLRRLFSDRELIQLPGGRLLQGPFARLISSLRAPRVQQYYEEIGGGSPLVQTTRRQAALLSAALAPHGAFEVQVAMRYCAPRAVEAVDALQQRRVSRCLALPLYPQYSGATSGSSFNDLDAALAAADPAMERVRVEDFHDHPRYLEALADTVREACQEAGEGACVVFSAHSLPVRMIERGDPYQRQVQATVQGVVSRLGLQRWHLGYQSRSGPVKWLEPDVVRLVDELLQGGEKRLVIVPVSFVSDHIETLHEVDIRLRQRCLERGAEGFVRARSLNEDPKFIDALRQLVITKMAKSNR